MINLHYIQKINTNLDLKEDNEICTKQQHILQDWIAQNGNDYIAHAIWKDNVASVVKKGALLPAELVLREMKEVEYEKGAMFGSRGKIVLPELTLEEIQSIEDMLSDEEKKELSDLRSRKAEEIITPEEYKEWKELTIGLYPDLHGPDLPKHIKVIHTPESYQEYLQNTPDIIKISRDTISNEKALRIKELEAKMKLTLQERKRLKLLERIKFGMLTLEYQEVTERKLMSLGSLGHDQLREDAVQSIIRRLKYPLSPSTKCVLWDSDLAHAILIAYDQAKENQIDRYLSDKYKKWVKKGRKTECINLLFAQARYYYFFSEATKLNREIRCTRNYIPRSYGSVAILRGKPENIINRQTRGEYLLLSPWQNEGQLFSLPLCQDNTIVIGDRASLEPHAQELEKKGIKFAYHESMTDTQKKFFEVPEK